MNCTRVLALALKVLTTENRDVTKQLALALCGSTVNFSGRYVVKIVFFVSMTAKTGAGWPNRAAVHPISGVAPISI